MLRANRGIAGNTYKWIGTRERKGSSAGLWIRLDLTDLMSLWGAKVDSGEIDSMIAHKSKKMIHSPDTRHKKPDWLSLASPRIFKRVTPLLLLACSCHATEFVVTTEDDETYEGGTLAAETDDGNGLSLREAIALANQNGGAPNSGEVDGDTITFSSLFLVAPSLELTTGDELLITDDVLIDGAGLIGNATIDGALMTRLFNIDTSVAEGDAAVVLSNLSLQNGTADNGGAIKNNGLLTISNSEFTSNVAAGGEGIPGSGGAIFNDAGGKLTISATTFASNRANRAGGAIEDNSGGTEGFDLMLTDVVFTGNNAGVAPATAAPGNGGAIHITGTGSAMITGGSATGNIAAREGGAFWNDKGVTTLSMTMIATNTASGPAADDGGGGIFNNGGTLNVSGASLSGNIADGLSGSGGGIFSTDGAVTISDTEISGNVANRAGGGLEVIAGNLDLINVTLGGDESTDGNIAGPSESANPGNGGGLHISAETTTNISGGSVAFNSAAREGGGLWNQTGSTMTLTGGVTVSDNSATGAAADDGGGGIFNNGGALLINDTDGAVTIARNVASGAAGSGGGIFNFTGGTVELTGTILSQNVANRAGGGIEEASESEAALVLTNVILTENNAGVAPANAAPGNGGGIHVSGSGGVSITGGEISANVAASEGGGLWNGSGPMSVSGSIISSNIASGNDADQGGGGIYNLSGSLTIDQMTTLSGNIADGTAGSGGGILNDVGGEVFITSSALSGNRANRAGGAIEDNSGEGVGITLTDTTMQANLAGTAPAVAAPGNGGALHISGAGSAVITGGLVTENFAAREGGGLWNSVGTMSIDGTMISLNEARGAELHDGGGGVFNNGGTVVINNSAVISGNLATGALGSGGGIQNLTGGVIMVSSSTITGNQANRAGGGIEDQSALESGFAIMLNDVELSMNNAGVDPAVGAPGSGGGLHVSGVGSVWMNGGTVSENVCASEGGGLWNGVGTLTVFGVGFSDNIASGAGADQGGGAIFNAGGTLNVFSSSLSANIADGASGSGGAILNDAGGVTLVAASDFTGNIANRAGGAIEDNSGAGLGLSLTNNSFTANNAGVAPAAASPGNGGAVHITGAGNSNITGGSVTGNLAAAEGGGLWNGTGSMTIRSVDFTGNIASGSPADQGGGALFNAGGLMDVGDGCVLTGNIADGASGSGGAILNDGAGTLLVARATLSNNISNRAGGAIEVTGGTTTSLELCTITGNSTGEAPGNGGALHISSSGSVTVVSSDVSGNTAANEGGGLWNSGAGSLIVESSGILGNQAPDGGGLFNQAGGGITSVSNTTVAGNMAANGAGLQIEGGTMSLLNVTLAANAADTMGGGANVAGGALAVVNTIVADNSSPVGPDVAGAVSMASFSLLQDPTDTTGITDAVDGNIVGVSALLTPLADNGGLTQTLRPLSTSPVVNSGSNAAASGISFDQRGSGFDRLVAGTVDMGALEVFTLNYAGWADMNFTEATPLELRGPNDDPDMDGLENSLEYLTGMSPEQADANPFQLVVSKGMIGLTYPRLKNVPNDADVFETSTDLTIWTEATDPAPTRVSMSNSATLETVTLSVPNGDEPRLFGRLNVTAN